MEKKYRLRDSEDFDRVHKEGKTYRHPLAILAVLPNNMQYSRFGFSVSKKVGKATARNRAKRLLREAVSHRLGSILPGRDLVFIARAPLPTATLTEVEAAVEKLLSQSRLLAKRT